MITRVYGYLKFYGVMACFVKKSCRLVGFFSLKFCQEKALHQLIIQHFDRVIGQITRSFL